MMNWTQAAEDGVTPGQIVYYTIHMIISFFIIAVNGVVVFILITTENLHSPTNWIFGSQAMADIMLAVLRPYHGLLEIRAYRHASACIIVSSLSVATGSISMEHLTLVSLDRYTMVTKPLRYSSLITLRRVRVATTITWICIIFLSLLPVMGVKRADFTDDSYCSAEFFMPLWYLILMVVVTFIIPSNILIMAYYRIFKIAYGQNRKIASENPTNSNTTSGLNMGLRSVKLFATLAGFFLICWSPYFIIRIIHIVSGVTLASMKWDYVALTFGMFNSLGNPLLYAFRQRDIRREVQKRLPWCSRNALRESVSNPMVSNIQTQSTVGE